MNPSNRSKSATDFRGQTMNNEQSLANDLKVLEKGLQLDKMHQAKKKLNKRTYKIDLKKNSLVANTRQCGKKQKIYLFEQLNEVKSGCNSVALKSYKQKSKKANELEDIAFVVCYDNYKKSLDLVAPNKTEQTRWINVLNRLIAQSKTDSNVNLNDPNFIKSHFDKADKSKDKKINSKEVASFLESINLQLNKDQIANLIERADKNKDGQLTEEEFKEFVILLFQRKEMMSLFYLISADRGSKILPDSLSIQRFKLFLEKYQKEQKTDQECIDLIHKYELDPEFKMRNQFSFQGFVNYMNDENQFILDPKCNKVYQNMNLPLCNYFINSSHNTYLSGDQVTSSSSADNFRAAIMNGARLVEMDVYDGEGMQPRIYHAKTLTSKMLFEDALIACKEYAFRLTDYPLIITIELHCSPEQQKVMANLMKTILGDHLYNPNTKPYPTLNELRRKILIRSGVPKNEKEDKNVKLKNFKQNNAVNKNNTQATIKNENIDVKSKELTAIANEALNKNNSVNNVNNQQIISIMKEILGRHPIDYTQNGELKRIAHEALTKTPTTSLPNSQLISIIREVLGRDPNNKNEFENLSNIVNNVAVKQMKKADSMSELNLNQISEYTSLLNLKNTKFKGVEDAMINFKPNSSCSLVETTFSAISVENPKDVIKFTNNFTVKWYPSGVRLDSSNLEPHEYWVYGFQIAALNFQTRDDPYVINKGMFNDNGKCGYVLKPEILRDPTLNFNPFITKTMKNKKLLEIKIISAIQLPQNENLVRDISDPYVEISVFGVGADLCEKKTRTVNNNGFNPIWNEDFKFVINCPELALIKFAVKDEDVGEDDLIGDYAIRFENIRPGYRHIKLDNPSSKGLVFVGIKISSIPNE